jgi:hypothetical protein
MINILSKLEILRRRKRSVAAASKGRSNVRLVDGVNFKITQSEEKQPSSHRYIAEYEIIGALNLQQKAPWID